MLRFDLSNGAGPCTDAVVPRSCSRAHPPHEHYPDLGFGGVLRLRKGSRAEDIGEDFIGRMLVLSNCAIPGASLAVGIVRFGLEFEREILPVGPTPCAQHSNSAVDSRAGEMQDVDLNSDSDAFENPVSEDTNEDKESTA